MLNSTRLLVAARYLKSLLFSFMLSGLLLLAFSSVWASELPVLVGIGGSFAALDSNNNPITEADLKGKPVLMAFGYTNCADICPITVGYMRNVYERLTPEEQKQVQFVFVTVDPEYDTPAHLKAFLANFNPDFIGISGSQAQTDKLVENYKVDYHRLSNSGVPAKFIRRIEDKVKQGQDEGMNHAGHKMEAGTMTGMGMTASTAGEQVKLFTHSAHLFVIDKDMQTRSLAHTGTPKDELATELRSLIVE